MIFFIGVMKSFDESVGRVVKTLDNNKMLDNTILLVFSDNGGPTIGLYNNTASNFPLRGVSIYYVKEFSSNLKY